MMKKVFCLLILFALLICVGFAACADANKDYSLSQENGQHYLVFDDITKYERVPEEGVNIGVDAFVSFSSMTEFRDAVIKGDLTDHQKTTIANHFPKDENGNILICDMNNLYTPTTPGSNNMGNVIWNGQRYSVSLTLDNGVDCGYGNLPEKDYQSKYQQDYVNFLSNNNITVTSQTVDKNGKTITRYDTDAGTYKSIQYTLTEGNKTIAVDKLYCLKTNNSSSDTSGSIPYRVTLYCTEGDQYYIFVLSDFDIAPTDQWLLKFGITEFA